VKVEANLGIFTLILSVIWLFSCYFLFTYMLFYLWVMLMWKLAKVVGLHGIQQYFNF